MKCNWKYKKSIQLSDQCMRDLATNLFHYCDKIEYRCILSNERTVDFDSLDELLSYTDSAQILSMILYGTSDAGSTSLIIRICPATSLLIGYHYTVNCDYLLQDDQSETDFKDSLNHIFDKAKRRYWFLSKITVFMLLIIYLIYFISVFLISVSKGLDFAITTVEYFVIILPAVLFLAIILYLVQTYLSKKCFPPVLFNWGEEAFLTAKKSKIKLAWCISVTIILGIFLILLPILIYRYGPYMCYTPSEVGMTFIFAGRI